MALADARLTARLDRTPEATTYQVDRLAERVLAGEVRVPSFQRGLRWEDEDRLALFDSIYRGFPVGTLLLWKHEGPAAIVRIGDLTISAGNRSDVLWIVDGQQRVTTLANALLRVPALNERAIFFDLELEDFVYARAGGSGARPGDDANRWLPLSVVLDSEKLVDWVVENPRLSAERRKRAIEIGKRIREYQLPAYVVEADDERVLRTIFHRTNRSGRKLHDTEVFEALFGSMASSQPARLADVAAALDGLGFGSIGEDEVLDALRAIEGLPPASDFTKALDRERIPDALRATEAALRRVIGFLRTDAGFVHRELLPYKLPLSVLSSFFHRFPEPVPRSRTLLRRWLWRGSLAGQLTGAIVGLRQHLACIVVGDEEGSVQALLKLVSHQASDEIVRLDRFRRDTARSLLHACALASLSPRDLRTGAPIDLARLLAAPDDAFPVVIAAKPGADERAFGIGNRLLHPKAPPTAMCAAIVDCDDDVVLASHAISREAREALEAGRVADFLALRGAVLEAAASGYFRRQTEPDADDSPSLATMVVED